MDTKRILERLDNLVNIGKKVLATRHTLPDVISAHDYVDEASFYQWRISSLAFLKNLPTNYVYASEFEKRCETAFGDETQQGLAILQGAREDIAGGYLQKVENIISASVFTDFLDMAEYLLTKGYKDPAASLVGAVLEDGLRRICANEGITLKDREDIGSLSQKLLQKQVYNPLQQKQIQVWNDIRNNADHGHFDQYTVENVKDMHAGVSKFLTDYLP